MKKKTRSYIPKGVVHPAIVFDGIECRCGFEHPNNIKLKPKLEQVTLFEKTQKEK